MVQGDELGGGEGRRLSKLWQSHLILMFAHIAIIDSSLFSGVRVHKTWQEARRGMCLSDYNENTAASSEHFTELSVFGGPAGRAQTRGPDATLLLELPRPWTRTTWTRSAQTFGAGSNSNQHPTFSEHWKCAPLNSWEVCTNGLVTSPSKFWLTQRSVFLGAPSQPLVALKLNESSTILC